MPTPNQSLRSTLRRSIREVYRGRGRRNSNLWLVYSVKTDRDWILPSDRQLVHWLYFLESEPTVSTFDLAPDPIVSTDDKEIRGAELDAVAVYRDGHIEWHEIKAATRNPVDRSQFLAQAAAATKEGVKYTVFTDHILRPIAAVALRWIKPLSFAAMLRGQEQAPCRTSLAAYFREHKKGTIRTAVTDLAQFDQPVVLGMMVRMGVENVIHFDLSRRSFGLQTEWSLNG